MAIGDFRWRYQVSGLQGMINALTRVASNLEDATMDPLNKVALAAWARTQKDVHVITGKLRASGRLETKTFNHHWRMTLKYGGRKNTPAYYAIYEMNKGGVKPGRGPHDFFAGLEELVDVGIEKAIDRHFAPMKGK